MVPNMGRLAEKLQISLCTKQRRQQAIRGGGELQISLQRRQDGPNKLLFFLKKGSWENCPITRAASENNLTIIMFRDSMCESVTAM